MPTTRPARAGALLGLAGAASIAVAAAAEPARFVSVVEDLPLAPTLSEISADTFETAAGRIVRVESEGRAAPGEVERFYAETLPALGWTLEPETAAAQGNWAQANTAGAEEISFARGRERLTLRIEPNAEAGLDGAVRATFVITPAD